MRSMSQRRLLAGALISPLSLAHSKRNRTSGTATLTDVAVLLTLSSLPIFYSIFLPISHG
jgi:hypothetical protein